MTRFALRVLLVPVFVCGVILGIAGFSVLADRDVYAYVLVGDGYRQNIYLEARDWLIEESGVEEILQAVIGEYPESLIAEMLNLLDPLGTSSDAFVAIFGDIQRPMFISTAERMEDALSSGWGIPTEGVETHHAWEMTRSEFLTSLEDFAKQGDQDGEDVFIFYYVGHGTSGSIVPFFEDTAKCPYSYLGSYGLYEDSGEWVVILDCCHSGTAKDTLSGSAWIMASVEDTLGFGWFQFQTLPFTGAIADAMEQSQGVKETFEQAMEQGQDEALPLLFPYYNPLTFKVEVFQSEFSAVTWQLSSPNLSIPSGSEQDDPLGPPDVEQLLQRLAAQAEIAGRFTDYATERCLGSSGDYRVQGSVEARLYLQHQADVIPLATVIEYEHFSDCSTDRVTVNMDIQASITDIAGPDLDDDALAYASALGLELQLEAIIPGQNRWSCENPSAAEISYRQGRFAGHITLTRLPIPISVPIEGKASLRIGWRVQGGARVRLVFDLVLEAE
ncbi:caspase family protein [Candidatus Bipolaricaulota bacterium]|nr:caspase family protein [Candidatus Bipolaricaulota bacterium]